MNRLIARLRNPARNGFGENGIGGNGERPSPGGVAPCAEAVRRATYVVTTAEAAPCTCPEFCERDHEND